MDKKCGPRGPYTTMDAAKVEILESRTDLIPAGMRVIGFKDEDDSPERVTSNATRYRLYIPKDAGWFVEQIGRLYAVELENRLLNRSDEQIKERRNRVDVTEIRNKLLDRANRMLKDKRIHFGEMMNTALNYMINGWEKLLDYRHDGRYDIDNLEAERKIRPLMIGRKNTLFFGSEEGVEVATTYYTLIETAKLI